MTKQLKAAGGHVVDIVGEVEHDGVEYHAIHYKIDDSPRDPFLIRKDNPNYKAYDLSGETPQAGDVVSGGHHAEYRVLGVIDGRMLIILKGDYADGEWITLPKGQLQEDVHLLRANIYIRPCPDDYLKVVERP